MLMTDEQIRAAIEARDIILDPFDSTRVEPASYDIRLGNRAFASSSKEVVNLSEKGVLIVEPGEFAVLESRERVELDRNTAAQLGLRSEYARQGLLLLSGPQIDPGFRGILVVRVVNLAPKRIALPHEAPFLTVQFFRLSKPSGKAYSGPQQGQTGITAKDIQELTETESLTLGQIMKTLSALAHDVAELKGSVSRLAWLVPLVVGIGMAVIGIVAAMK
jgi:dCTP deaminase